MWKNERGMTLVEILAAIVLLTILLVSFLPFFAHSTNSSLKLEDKLVAANLAEQKLVELKRSDTLDLNTTTTDINRKKYYLTTDAVCDQKTENLVPIEVNVFNVPDVENARSLSTLFGYVEDGGTICSP